MKKRKNIVILLISMMVFGIIPPTVSMASGTRVTKVVNAKLNEELIEGKVPDLFVGFGDAHTTDGGFYLNLVGATWGDHYKSQGTSLNVEAGQNVIGTVTAFRINDRQLKVVTFGENYSSHHKIRIPLFTKITDDEARVEVENNNSSVTDGSFLFAVDVTKTKAQVEVVNKNIPIFYKQGNIAPIVINEAFLGHFIHEGSFDSEEKRTITVALENPEFSFNISALERVSFRRGLSGREDVPVRVSYAKNDDKTDNKKIIQLVLPQILSGGNQRGSMELNNLGISSIVNNPKEGDIKVTIDGIMIEKAVGIRVGVVKNTVPAGGTSSGDTSPSGSSSSSGDKDTDDIKITTIPAKADQSNPLTQTTVAVKSTIEKDTANVTVSQSTVDNAIKKAQEASDKNAAKNNGIKVEIKVDDKINNENKSVNNISVGLPKATIDLLAKAEVTELSINSTVGTFALDLETLKTIQNEIKGDIKVSANKVDNKTLSEEVKEVVGNRPVFDFSITGTDGKQVTDFGKGKVSIEIPYILAANEKAENLLVYYIDNEDKLYEMPNFVYNTEAGIFSFDTDHFSKFALGYKEDEEDKKSEEVESNTSAIIFTDTENHWAKKDIEFVTARGLFGGTDQEKFSPNVSMTRGMLVTVLARLAKADLSDHLASSFMDVKSDSYYMPAIEWARDNNIVNGLSATEFAPNQAISREQLAVIMVNYAKASGFEFTSQAVENNFVDQAKISSYAKSSVKEIQMSGLISGREDNTFDPQGTATRAEVSAVLKRFVEAIEAK
ncbi:MAG TPA: S-layer homology domain-containing protein [Epulopiscium sp.]|nr:S-layer homology domain-containing protein [Candidatus Epulonipiscium sp.]